MKKSIIVCVIIFAVLIKLAVLTAFAQGFVNLDFESANLSGFSAGLVPATNAIPGWTAYIGGVPLTNINYNTSTTFGGIEVDILGTNSGYPLMQGNYFMYLQGGSIQSSSQASIGQTGTIPSTAQSLILWGSSSFGAASFKGVSLSFALLTQTANY